MPPFIELQMPQVLALAATFAGGTAIQVMASEQRRQIGSAISSVRGKLYNAATWR